MRRESPEFCAFRTSGVLSAIREGGGKELWTHVMHLPPLLPHVPHYPIGFHLQNTGSKMK